MQQRLEEIHRRQAGQEFSADRYALLFKPGEYDLEVTVDFYVQALGLGRTPDDVVIKGMVQSNWSTTNNKVTTQFWRGAENFKVYPDSTERWMLWAVSQAAPLRRMHIMGDINFDKGGWASGGVLANSIVTGRAGLTSGQQWFTRNSELGTWEGVTWQGGHEAGTSIPLGEFHIAQPGTDDHETINKALAAGKHLLLTPGLYELAGAIRIANANTVVLGLGLPTLIPVNGNAVIETSDVAGIKLAGFMVDAGLKESEVLIRIGESGADRDQRDNPSSLHDIYCRVGGAMAGTAGICLEINSNNVIGDHFWLWRADHGTGVGWDLNRSRNGLVVNGDDVTIYGLFNEHFQGYQTLWNGERGRTYFYQSEVPYEPPSNVVWQDEGAPGLASYKVGSQVREHQAWGLGIYSFFRGEETTRNNVRLESAMSVPDRPGIRITHVVTFAGRAGGMNHVINGIGPATNAGELNRFDGVNGE